jgi:hypothetical protein
VSGGLSSGGSPLGGVAVEVAHPPAVLVLIHSAAARTGSLSPLPVSPREDDVALGPFHDSRGDVLFSGQSVSNERVWAGIG